MSCSPKKRTFYHFSVGGTWQRPTVWTIHIYRYHFIFIEFRWKKKTFQRKKPDTFFNRWLSVAKKLRENDNGKKINNFILQGEHDKRGIWQRVLRYIHVCNQHPFLQLDLGLVDIWKIVLICNVYNQGPQSGSPEYPPKNIIF